MAKSKDSKVKLSVSVLRVYYPPDSTDDNDAMVALQIEQTVPSEWSATKLVPLNKCIFTELKRVVPALPPLDKKSAYIFDVDLNVQVHAAINDPAKRGLFLNHQGAFRAPDGNLCFLRGNEVIGECPAFIVANEYQGIQLQRRRASPDQLLQALLEASPLVLLTVCFVVLASVRSLVYSAGIDLQAVLYVVGVTSIGKSYLVRRLCLPYTIHGQQIGIVQAISTSAAAKDACAFLGNAPFVVDDLCESTGTGTVHKRKELVADLIRFGADHVPQIKKAGIGNESRLCEAGLIFTGEFALDAASDINRCVFVPINERLNIPNTLDNAAIGDLIYIFSQWLIDHDQKFIGSLKCKIACAEDNVHDSRVSKSFAILRCVCMAIGLALVGEFSDQEILNKLEVRFDMARQISLDYQDKMLAEISRKVKKANILYLILGGLEKGYFKLAKETNDRNKAAERLSDNKVDGIFYKGQFLAKPTQLKYFLNQQDGYQDYSYHAIVKELMQIGALRIQSNGQHSSYTVQISKDAPYTYALRLKALKDEAKIL